MSTAIFEALSGAGEWFVKMFNLLVALFWTPAESGTGGNPTFIGYLGLAAVSIGLCFGLLRLIRGFLRMRG